MMVLFTTWALPLALIVLNAAALPTTSDVLETRQNSDMASQINSYISLLEQACFQPNAKPTISQRQAPNLESAVEKRTQPKINLVISLLEQHGFQPSSNKTASKRDDIPSQATPLMKRDVPDINLVISLLQQHGFVPTQAKKTSRSVEKRQSSSDINYVINELIAAGYNPADFGPAASSMINSFLGSLPTETTATCPKDNNTLYATGGQTYEVLCGFDFSYNDLPTVHADTLAACLGACSSYVPNQNVAGGAKCLAASWGPGNPGANCYLKFNVTQANANSGIQSGRNMNAV